MIKRRFLKLEMLISISQYIESTKRECLKIGKRFLRHFVNGLHIMDGSSPGALIVH